MKETLFCSLNFASIAAHIREAQYSVCYAAPGIQTELANAMAEVAARKAPPPIAVCLDFDEHVMRMGFGELGAVKTLRDAGIVVTSTPGLRTGLLIVDHQGYIFTPTALYLEPDGRATDAPNAMRLSKDQVSEALARLSPAANAMALIMAKTEKERDRIRDQAPEMASEPVEDEAFQNVERRLAEAPPARFDVTRQVNVFSAYLQYVELSLTGAAIQRQRIVIPPVIQQLGAGKDIEKRLRTTFDLIEKDGNLSSKKLDDRLQQIRRDFTPSLGKGHGRVVLKAKKLILEQRLDAFREELKAHLENVKHELQKALDTSREQIINYYIPFILANPPDRMHGQFLKIDEHGAGIFLGMELDRVFPTVESLVQKMQLEVLYKDLTYETLTGNGFLAEVKKAFPQIEWDKPYHDFKAAGETLHQP